MLSLRLAWVSLALFMASVCSWMSSCKSKEFSGYIAQLFSEFLRGCDEVLSDVVHQAENAQGPMLKAKC